MTQTAMPAMYPPVNRISTGDVMAALSAGLADFRRAPAFGLFFGVVFSAIGIVIFLQLVVWHSSYWVLPITAGFPLAGPFLAVGLYEVSRRLAAGEALDWAAVLSVPLRGGARQIQWMAAVGLIFYLVWIYLAHLVFALTFGLKPVFNVMSSADLLTSPNGIVMLVVGTVVGGALAALYFAVSVVSVPMMLDREVDVVTAMVTSFRAVLENKEPMLRWAIIIAVLSAVAMVPLFLGMILVFPVLGHASWHLYTRTVAPA
jgi:uncharacterized membrane protein